MHACGAHTAGLCAGLLRCVSLLLPGLTFANMQVVGTLPAGYSVVWPMGWSETGLFAYVVQDVNPLAAALMYHYDIVVRDMVTDSVVWHDRISYNFEDSSDSDYGFSWDDLPADTTPYGRAFWECIVWPRHQSRIDSILEELGIVRQTHEIEPIDQMARHGCAVEGTVRDSVEHCVTHYEVICAKANRSKTVYRYRGESCPGWYRAFRIIGFVKSPFEQRAAILLFRVVDGYEETFEYPLFVGVDLDSGFE